MIMPIGMITLAQAAGPERMGRVMSVVGVPMLLAPVLGPVLGGADRRPTCRWRWIFFVNLPIGLVGLVLAARLLPAGRAEGRAERAAERLDWRGLALLSPGVALRRLRPERGRRARLGDLVRVLPRHRRRLALVVAFALARGARRRRSSTCGCSRTAASRAAAITDLPRRRGALRLDAAPPALLPGRARPLAAAGAGCSWRPRGWAPRSACTAAGA